MTLILIARPGESHAGAKPARPARQRPGIASVEMAFMAVFVVAPMLIAMFELGRGILVRQVLSDAARKACRTGILPARGNADIAADAREVLNNNNIDGSAATITVKVNDVVVSGTTDAKTAQDGDKISVQVSIPLAKVCWTTKVFLKATNIQSETFVMMRQG